MATLTFDTYDFIERLKSSGIEEGQAKAIADGLKEVNLEHVATKEDIALVKQDIKDLETRMVKWAVPMLLGQAALIVALLKFL